MTDNARKEYNAYQNEWRKKNKDKVKRYNSNYWEKKALQQAAVQEDKQQ